MADAVERRECPNTAAVAALAGLCGRYLTENKFTHVFAEGGSLGHPRPQIHYSYLPEMRQAFDLGSLTKALVTTPLIFQLREKSGLDFDGTVGDWLDSTPRNLDSRILALSIKSILSHRSGLPWWRNFWIEGDFSQNPAIDAVHRHIELVLNRFAGEITDPGKFAYSDLGFILLGYIIEQRTGKRISECFRDLQAAIDAALSGNDVLQFRPLDRGQAQMVVSTSFCALRERTLLGEVHDENCGSMGGISGHAGLFGTGPAIVNYLSRLLQASFGKAMLTENAHCLVPGGDPLLGWRQRSKVPTPRLALGHLGFPGTAFWIDVVGEHYAVLLTNRVISGRISPWMPAFREAALEIIESETFL
jgi:CubicO group peptidase (beta-lactamase class C family)